MVRVRARWAGDCLGCLRSWRPGDVIYTAGDGGGWSCSPICAYRKAAKSDRSRAPRHEPRSAGAPWPATLLAETPPEWRGRVYRALARTLHPDAGGDNALAAALNDARDRLGAS
jgi:hypothetical protein